MPFNLGPMIVSLVIITMVLLLQVVAPSGGSPLRPQLHADHSREAPWMTSY